MSEHKLDFLIVGTMKGGTSTLAYMLGHHKEIYIPDKEIFYFSNDKNYRKGVNWYHSKIGKIPKQAKFAGEKTATYHFIDKSAERILNYNPDVKLIWIFRNPIKRSYSQYWHVQKQGGDNRSFDKAVEDEFNGITKNIFHKYLNRSMYADQVENYLKFFKKEQFHFLLFEDLLANPHEELNKVLDFLNAPRISQEELKLEPRNVTYISAFPTVLHIFRKVFGKTLVFRILRRVLQARKPGYPSMNKITKERLDLYFKTSVQRLKELTALDLKPWKM